MAFDDGVKTVSGSVAHTDDAAAKVPFVSVKCGIEPTLTGKSAIECTQAGKNLMENIKYQATSNRVNIGQSDDDFSVSLKKGTYTLSVSSSINVRAYYRGENDGSNTLINPTYSTSYSGTFTLSEDKDVRMWVIGQDDSVSTTDILTFQLEYGSTAHAYEPYTTTTVSTVNLGRTVYGGTADIVNGVGKNTLSAPYTFNGTENWQADTTRNGVYLLFSTMGIQNFGNGYCNMFSTIHNGAGLQSLGICFGVNNYAIYIPHLFDGSIAEVTDVATWKTYLTSHDCIILYPLATPSTFTFTPITPTPETVGKVNNVYCDTGDTELTYYDNAHGFAEVTVNKTGKNLLENNIEDGSTGGISYSKNADGSISCVGTVSNVNATRLINTVTLPIGNYILSGADSSINLRAVLYDGTGTAVTNRNDTGNGVTISVDSTIAYIEFRIKARTASEVVNTIISPMLAVGSSVLPYEPYEVVSKTAYLHKVIYGGQADVVRGTCEPINWLPNIATSKTQNGITWTVNADGTVTLEGTSTARTYLYIHIYFKILPHDATITVNVEGLYDNGASDVFVNIPYSDNGTTYSGNYGQCTWKNPTKQIDYTADKYIGFYIDCPSGVTTNQTVKITVSIGTTAHTYSPYFEPFTFTPISIGTDEGENTLFANEGDSAITYRKAVD